MFGLISWCFTALLCIADIIKDSLGSITAEDTKFKTIVIFDCRGVEPVDFSPRVRQADSAIEGGC